MCDHRCRRATLARYRQAFRQFDVAKCAALSDAQLEALLTGPLAIVRNRAKIWSVRAATKFGVRVAYNPQGQH